MKVIYESKPTKDKSQAIDEAIKILKYVQDGHVVEFKNPNGGWTEKDGFLFDTRYTSYRVLEKPKEIAVYTIIYWNS